MNNQLARQCGSCTLCCKIMAISELDKPRGKWCNLCNVGSGCIIYGSHPDECKNFSCGYLIIPELADYWYPLQCKMIITSELDGNRIAIHVDPDRPNAWKNPPYYSDIKYWACQASVNMRQVVVCIGSRAIVIFPNEDIDLGFVSDDQRILVAEVEDNGGSKLIAMKLQADDPRLAGMEAGTVYNRR